MPVEPRDLSSRRWTKKGKPGDWRKPINSKERLEPSEAFTGEEPVALSESRMRENRPSGLTSGMWKRKSHDSPRHISTPHGGFRSLKPIESRRDERKHRFVSAISAAPSGLSRFAFTPTVKTVGYFLSSRWDLICVARTLAAESVSCCS